MGGINIKLIQGIDDAESQLQKEKQTQKGEEKVEHGTKDIQKLLKSPRKQRNSQCQRKTHQ